MAQSAISQECQPATSNLKRGQNVIRPQVYLKIPRGFMVIGDWCWGVGNLISTLHIPKSNRNRYRLSMIAVAKSTSNQKRLSRLFYMALFAV